MKDKTSYVPMIAVEEELPLRYEAVSMWDILSVEGARDSDLPVIGF
jgi:hypothetical protein